MATSNIFLPLISGKLTILGALVDWGLTLAKILFWNTYFKEIFTYVLETSNFFKRPFGGYCLKSASEKKMHFKIMFKNQCSGNSTVLEYLSHST